jgi:hypothetical protein
MLCPYIDALPRRLSAIQPPNTPARGAVRLMKTRVLRKHKLPVADPQGKTPRSVAYNPILFGLRCNRMMLLPTISMKSPSDLASQVITTTRVTPGDHYGWRTRPCRNTAPGCFDIHDSLNLTSKKLHLMLRSQPQRRQPATRIQTRNRTPMIPNRAYISQTEVHAKEMKKKPIVNYEPEFFFFSKEFTRKPKVGYRKSTT